MEVEKKESNPHTEHRKRVREEFLIRGFEENTPPHKLLEFLLFYCIPRKDTNELAHKMLNEYKTIAGVLDAPIEGLMKYPGITENGVALMKLIMPIARRYVDDKQKDKKYFTSLDDMGDYILSKYIGIQNERMSLLYLNAKGALIKFEFVAEGDVDSVGLSIKDVMHRVIENGAASVVMAHNHPSNVAIPSANDCLLTEMVSDALARINVKLIDHVIIGIGDYVSLVQSAEYVHLFK